MRHADYKTTSKHYVALEHADVSQALASLTPIPDAPCAAVGQDVTLGNGRRPAGGSARAAKSLASSRTKWDFVRLNETSLPGPDPLDEQDENHEKHAEFTQEMAMAGTGLEPVTSAFSVPRSTN